jgi:hypothetical protein
MSNPLYQVTAVCVTNIPSASGAGVRPGQRTLITLMQGALLPVDVPEATVRHLLDSGMIAEVEG